MQTFVLTTHVVLSFSFAAHVRVLWSHSTPGLLSCSSSCLPIPPRRYLRHHLPLLRRPQYHHPARLPILVPPAVVVWLVMMVWLVTPSTKQRLLCISHNGVVVQHRPARLPTLVPPAVVAWKCCVMCVATRRPIATIDARAVSRSSRDHHSSDHRVPLALHPLIPHLITLDAPPVRRSTKPIPLLHRLLPRSVSMNPPSLLLLVMNLCWVMSPCSLHPRAIRAVPLPRQCSALLHHPMSSIRHLTRSGMTTSNNLVRSPPLSVL